MRAKPLLVPRRCAMLLALAAGFWWALSSANAQLGAPTRADIHSITGLHHGLRVYWHEPSENGGSPLTGYGVGPWSTTESRRTSPSDCRPDQPWPPTLEAGDGRDGVSWAAPAYTGGQAITGYRVRYTTDDAATWRSWATGGNRLIRSTATTITGLDNGVTVGVVVAAVNGRGQGRYSSPIAEAAPAQALSPPPAPSLRVMPLSRALQVSWSEISVQPPVASFELEFQSIGWNESNWPVAWTRLDDDIAADASAYTHDELSPDRRYRYRLRARNSVGAGDWSVASPAAGAQPQPGAPTLKVHTAASGSVKLTWSGGPASTTRWDYRIRSGNSEWSVWTAISGADPTSKSHTVSDLTEDARYRFQLAVVNASGPSPASDVADAVAGLTP
ncbi:MAG: fibronectin type III domain-containing protein, partial [Chloroflexi bacterium]|nr:fibronectin type III domain-containing protein [Chloroflexota bacterium]